MKKVLIILTIIGVLIGITYYKDENPTNFKSPLHSR